VTTHSCVGCTSRRALLTGAGAVGVSALLTGCATYGEVSGDVSAGGGAPVGGSSGAPVAGASGGAASGAPAPGRSGAAPAPAGPTLAKTADIPVGGGKVFGEAKVVVTQPTQGSFKCFSAICTHQGCAVTDVGDGTINCGCHGSKFAIADGSVSNPPADRPLPGRSITVENGEIRLA
jgi:Rieske Fe-S protein